MSEDDDDDDADDLVDLVKSLGKSEVTRGVNYSVRELSEDP